MTLGTLAIAPLWTIRAEIFAVMCFVSLGALLTAPATAGPFPFVGSLVTLVLWSNLHGSFPLGFAMIGVRAFAPLIKRGLDAAVSRSPGSLQAKDQPKEGKRSAEPNIYTSDARRWMLTWALSVPAMAFMNPYGVANLQMPFQQVNAEVWTSWVPFWQPLMKFETPFRIVLYHGGRSLPFIIEMLIFLILAVPILFLGRFRRSAFFTEPARHPIKGTVQIAEFLILALVLVLALRWGRAAIFAALALVPPVALLMHTWAEELKAGLETTASTVFGRGLRWIRLVMCLTFLGLVTAAFLGRTLPPLVRENPLLPSSNIAERLFGMYWGDAHRIPDFLRNNTIKGRVLCSGELSDFLLLNVPEIRIWIDVRAQSIYTDKTFTEFQAVMSTDPSDPRSAERSRQLLNTYKISCAVLEHRFQGLIVCLLESQVWQPIYFDDTGIVFVRRESEFMKRFYETNNLSFLWFPDARSRILSSAFLSLKRKERLSPELEEGLRDTASDAPSPHMYWLIFKCSLDNDGCLKTDARSYLLSAFRKLAALDHQVPHGVRLTFSMLEIMELIEGDLRRCRGESPPAGFLEMRAVLLNRVKRFRKQFLPWGETRSGW